MESSYVLDSRLRGNDTLGLAPLGNGRLLHSVKMLPDFVSLRWPFDSRRKGGMLDSRFRGNDTLALARQGNGRLLPSAKMLQILKVKRHRQFLP